MSNFMIIFTDDYGDDYYGPFTKDEIPSFVNEFAKKYDINKYGFGNIEIEKDRIILKKKNEFYGEDGYFGKEEFIKSYIGKIVELKKELPEHFIIRHGH